MRKFYVVNVPRFSLCFCGNHSNFTFWSKNVKLPLAILGRLRHALVTKTIEEKQQKEWSPGIATPVVFFYMKQYMASVLPMEIVDAARVDGSVKG